MIAIDIQDNLVSVAVLGEFTLADFKQFEEHVLYNIHLQGSANLLVDLRDMIRYSVDVAWEEIKFTREHQYQFGKVAVVTDNQWITWSAWLQRFYFEADIEVFDDYDEAMRWLNDRELPEAP
jgi:hypothetical protein